MKSPEVEDYGWCQIRRSAIDFNEHEELVRVVDRLAYSSLAGDYFSQLKQGFQISMLVLRCLLWADLSRAFDVDESPLFNLDDFGASERFDAERTLLAEKASAIIKTLSLPDLLKVAIDSYDIQAAGFTEKNPKISHVMPLNGEFSIRPRTNHGGFKLRPGDLVSVTANTSFQIQNLGAAAYTMYVSTAEI